MFLLLLGFVGFICVLRMMESVTAENIVLMF
jgi:hypothetical protein